jgi:uncharacterized protein YbjT (DUF2867 family)
MRTMLRALLVILPACAALLAGCAQSGKVRQAGAEPLVLVAGASGRTGQEVVKLLIARGYHVRALVRDATAAADMFAGKAQIAVGDVRDAAQIEPAMRGVRFVVSAVGSNTRKDPTDNPQAVDFGGVRNLVAAARAANVEQFVLISAMGVTDPDHYLNKILDNVLLWKLKGENALRASGLGYTIVRPGGLTDEPGGRHGIRVMQGDSPEQGLIPRADVAIVCVQALGNPAAINRTLEILSDETQSPPAGTDFFAGLRPDPPEEP